MLQLGSNALFVGDLPKYATESDLHSIFQSYGPILDVKIKKNAVTGKSLAYGFVTLATWEAANAAKDALDNYMLMGRKLRVRWAAYNNKVQDEKDDVINSVYIRFSANWIERPITEEDIHQAFSNFGPVDDVSIKEVTVDPRLCRQSGYGFVHYPPSEGGRESAFRAVRGGDNWTWGSPSGGISFNVELSRNLLKQFGSASAGGVGGNGGKDLGLRKDSGSSWGSGLDSFPAQPHPQSAHPYPPTGHFPGATSPGGMLIQPPHNPYPHPSPRTHSFDHFPPTPSHNIHANLSRTPSYDTPPPLPPNPSPGGRGGSRAGYFYPYPYPYTHPPSPTLSSPGGSFGGGSGGNNNGYGGMWVNVGSGGERIGRAGSSGSLTSSSSHTIMGEASGGYAGSNNNNNNPATGIYLPRFAMSTESIGASSVGNGMPSSSTNPGGGIAITPSLSYYFQPPPGGSAATHNDGTKRVPSGGVGPMAQVSSWDGGDAVGAVGLREGLKPAVSGTSWGEGETELSSSDDEDGTNMPRNAKGLAGKGSKPSAYMSDFDLFAQYERSGNVSQLQQSQQAYASQDQPYPYAQQSSSADSAALAKALDAGGTSVSSWLTGGLTAFVTQLYDQSGNNRHANQTVSASQPTYDAINKNIAFGADDWLNTPPNCMTYGSLPFTTVSRHGTITNSAGGGIFGFGTSNSGEQISLRRVSATHFRFSFSGPTADYTPYRDNSVVSMVYNSGTASISGYIDGAFISTNSMTARNGVAVATGNLGRLVFTAVTDSYLKGTLFYVIFSNTALDDSNRRVLEGYDMPTPSPTVRPTSAFPTGQPSGQPS
eukprot:gene26128-31549_t